MKGIAMVPAMAATTSRWVARVSSRGQDPPDSSPVSTKSHAPSRTASATITRISGSCCRVENQAMSPAQAALMAQAATSRTPCPRPSQLMASSRVRTRNPTAARP